MLPEDRLRTIIKDTIEKSIDEKIPHDLGKIINDLKADYDQKMEALETDNRVLKKTILEQQKFLGMRCDKVKNNIFITGIPSSHTIKENNVTDKEIITQHIIKYIKNELNNGHYKIVNIFDPVEGRNNFSAKVTFND